MIDEYLWPCHVVLVALYLRGAPRSFMPPRRKWPLVVGALREAALGVGDAPAVLAEAGLWEEACLLGQRGLLAWASEYAPQALTPICDGYPAGWLTTPSISPPAVWFRGALPTLPMLGVVGSRSVKGPVARFAAQVGAEAARLRYAVVSGGAVGCDTFGVAGALRAGGEAVRILPCGFATVAQGEACDISACAPHDLFSTGGAMERNALIYGAASATVVVHARFREGGTWHGATDALRRRVGRIVVREDASSPAHRAMVALGAAPLGLPGQLAEVLVSISMPSAVQQSSLFAVA